MKENQSLKVYNTFGVEAMARFFIEVRTESELQEALGWLAKQENCPLLILGGGSNLLFTRDWPGLVLKVSLIGQEIKHETSEIVQVQAAAGENWHDFVVWTVEQGWGGLENLSLIPGQVGTTPVQNIGAYGVEIKDTLLEVEAINIKYGTKKVFNNKCCEFGYRDSIFKNTEKGQWIITTVTFTLSKKPKVNIEYGTIQKTLKAHGITSPTPKQVSQVVTAIRQTKLPDPAKVGNGGSFFKNPIIKKIILEGIQNQYPDVPFYEVKKAETMEQGDVSLWKVPAGWLIEAAGWKGCKIGEAGVHEHQALVLVNHGQATGIEIWNLAKDIQSDIFDRFGILLEPEINII